MGKRVGMEVAIAAAEAVALCNIDVAAVYPITPQSHIAEHMADIVHDGRIDAEFITVESEHSAISACAGASAAGARAYTATSSQGLMLMHEILPIVSAMRLPVCMANANRAVSGPLNIWNDHSDIMPQRDSGWICLFTENGQEVIDLSIMSFKIAEDPEVMLPCVVNIDGFQLTHMIEPFELPSQAEVAKFLPPRKPFAQLHPDNPISMGCFAMPDTYAETVKAKDVALRGAKKVVTRVFADWAKRFGRKYNVVETYKAKDADTLMLTMGSMGETASAAVDEMRKAGRKVGLVKLRLWRPFPVEEFKAAVAGCKTLIVMDRALSTGGAGGPVATDVKSVLYGEKKKPRVLNVIAGLGGRDLAVRDFENMFDLASKKKDETFEFYGVRE
ncbi:MAG: pyruvate ferredoxin oxidoreductase [Syntrophaceae bacterium]|nr:pyruvate ferredoxin oxidoreductase [Syntrophaceae bacterium]